MSETAGQQGTTSPAGKSHEFQADVARLLHLMVHSVYSEREIFLRELISNGADACEKLRYEALSNPELASGDQPFAITIGLDKENRCLWIADNGIGMGEAEMAEALGTIAKSGTRAYLERLAAARPEEDRETDGGGEGSTNLIGQFGIGFYSAFMVADRIEVVSRKAGESGAFCWASTGGPTYELGPADDQDAPARGTRVTLHLKADAEEFLEPYRIRSIVREHSSSIPIAVWLVETPGADPSQMTDGTAIWTRQKSAISAEEYADFYKTLSNQLDEPDLTIHWRAEGRNEYTVLGFVPGSRPLDLFDPARKGRGRLYVRRVLITDDSDLLPGWLRFVRLVVDSADLPLNVSREMIQQSPVLAAIRNAIVNRIVQELKRCAKDDPDKFASIWRNFGAVIKEGLYEDPQRRDQLFEIARFASTRSGEETRTLAQYVEDMKANQTSIFYIAGEDKARLEMSPHLEGFKARGVEVLLLSDPVDSFWVTTAVGYEGKPLKSVTQGDADLSNIPLKEDTDDKEEQKADKSDIAGLLNHAKSLLEDHVEDVRASQRLSDSPACLVASASAMDRRLERILADHGQAASRTKPVLEINDRHELVASLARQHAKDPSSNIVEDALYLLYDEARVIDGEGPQDPQAFAQRLFRLMARALD